ncbi:PAS domain-containing hybrid sensor histidine kinase/response regulator [Arsenicibacter rosenii]|uniref:Sensory/regulatory protein RpfC n=1 Tax=Arsenicibacter rosenii TaxID=1750698 RepID=A0A1S2VKJ4_9BACT|nr:ATP-binding protein [Arsenicibacter rosenii]OIN59281.1 hypothetical protein BLX24_09850 [Arsenicibacter rosenii]
MNVAEEVELLKRRIQREINARKQAEKLLEEKSLELYRANEELKHMNTSLETAVKERTDSLLLSEMQYRSLIQNLHSGVLLENEHRKIVLTNQIFCDLFDIPVNPDLLVGADCSQSAEQSKHAFEDPDGFVRRVDTLLQEKKLCIGEELKMNDGRILERDYIPIVAGDRYLGHLWRYEDITEQRKVQDIIRYSEEKYRGIIENMELGLIEVDNHDIIQKVYPRFSKLVGYAPEELVGKRAKEVLLPDDSFRRIIDEQNKHRLSGEPGVYEVPLRRKDGQIIWVIISGAPIIEPSGKVTGSIGIHLDISERKRTQEALEEARRIAEEARKAEKRFLANMSHEIRTPINGIIGMTHLLYDTELTVLQREYLDAISHSADLLLALVSDVLDISKIEAGEMQLTERPFNLPDLLNELTKTFKLRLRDKPVKIESLVDTQIQRTVMGDATMLRQILMNLIGNAVKFTEKGSVRVQVTLLDQLGDFLMTEVSVTDTGIGIAPQHLETIFESFKQADRDVKSKYGGTGLGLAIVKQLVNLHGGEIAVESALNQGATFTFTLPLKIAGDEDLSIVDEHGKIDSACLESKKILIVEDNPLNKKYVEGLLRKWKAEYDVADNGLEAIRLVEQHTYDLVLMDLMMPVMNGFETTVRLRSMKANPNAAIPIIALTATAFAKEQSEAIASGMNDCLSKPFTPDQLLQLLQRYLPTPETPAVKTGLLPDPFNEPADPSEPYTYSTALDVEQLEQFYGHDYSYAHMMFSLFMETTFPELGKIEEVIAAQDWKQLAALSHQFRPSLVMVGLTEVANTGKQFELLLKASPSDEQVPVAAAALGRIVAEKLPLIKQEFARLGKAIE